MRATHAGGRTLDLNWRRGQLKALRQAFHDHHEDITAALLSDHKNSFKVRGVFDRGHAAGAITQALSCLSEWTADKHSAAAPTFGSAFVRPTPKGVMLIVAPWNFPFAMCFDPLIPAIAAGNAVVIKPSEVAPSSARVVQMIVEKYLDRDLIKVVQGEVPETTALLAQRWDHIMYTGNGHVGRIVMAAAAKHLTPVTLELGGKSPTYVDSSASLDHAAARITFGKFAVNAGQICIAPDYVLVHEDVADEFARKCKAVLASFFGRTDKQVRRSKAFARVINERHVRRVNRLLSSTSGTVVAGGSQHTDEKAHYIAPSIVLNPSLDDPIMKEEIFGPLLPIVKVSGVDHAVEITNRVCAQPLALYVFAEDQAVIDRYVSSTQSGGVCINSVVEHQGAHDMPFGGVGESGLGRYHGKYGFDEFSHHRSILRRSTAPVVGRPLSGVFADPNTLVGDTIYKLAVRLKVIGFLSESQWTFVKAALGTAGAAFGAYFMRSRL